VRDEAHGSPAAPPGLASRGVGAPLPRGRVPGSGPRQGQPRVRSLAATSERWYPEYGRPRPQPGRLVGRDSNGLGEIRSQFGRREYGSRQQGAGASRSPREQHARPELAGPRCRPSPAPGTGPPARAGPRPDPHPAVVVPRRHSREHWRDDAQAWVGVAPHRPPPPRHRCSSVHVADDHGLAATQDRLHHGNHLRSPSMGPRWTPVRTLRGGRRAASTTRPDQCTLQMITGSLLRRTAFTMGITSIRSRLPVGGPVDRSTFRRECGSANRAREDGLVAQDGLHHCVHLPSVRSGGGPGQS
jgi:hypothetical protein